MEINRRSILKGLLCLPLLGISKPNHKAPIESNRQGNLIDLLRDSRFLDLMRLAEKVKGETSMGLHLYPSQNIYLLDHMIMDSSIKKTKDYFGQKTSRSKEDKLYDKYSRIHGEAGKLIAWGTTVKIQYLKEFEDGLIQIVGFGGEWESEPNTCWALYGHIVSEQGK